MEQEQYLAMERAGGDSAGFIVAFLGAPQWSSEGSFAHEAEHSTGVLAFRKAEAAIEAARSISNSNPRSKVGILFGHPNREAVRRAFALAEHASLGQIHLVLVVREMLRDTDLELELVSLGSGDIAGRREAIFLLRNPDRLSTVIEPGPEGTQALFVGRQAELDRMKSAIDTARIVTVHGDVGGGKSAFLKRFILEVEDDFKNGAWYVDMQRIDVQEAVLVEICRALDVHIERGEDRLRELISAFRSQDALIVIDNCTAVLNSVASIVATLVKECPGLQIIIGSKRRLKISGEQRFVLGGLEYPVVGEHWEVIRNCDAVALFEDRAASVLPGFRITKENADDVAQICKRLDGNPLAIEMVAQKIAILSPRQILGKLSEFLSSGKNKLVDAIQLSVQELPREAQLLLARLSVFQGAFPVEWVEKVCSDDQLARNRVVECFGILEDSSLLKLADIRSMDRLFHLTEPIHAYAKQAFAQDSNLAEIRANHRTWCLEFVKEAEEGLHGEEQQRWLDLMDAAYSDLRFVINDGRSPMGDLSISARILIASHPYLLERNYYNEGFAMAEKVLKIRGATTLPEYPRLLNMAGVYAFFLGLWNEAEDYAQLSLKLARKAGNDWQAGRACNTIGMARERADDLPGAHEYYLESRRLVRGKSVDEEITVLTNLLGIESNLGLFEESMTHYYEAQTLRDDCHDAGIIGNFLLNACHAALLSSRYSEAGHLIVDGLELCVELRDRNSVGLTMRMAARLAICWGRYRQAAVFIGAADMLLSRSESLPLPWADRIYKDTQEKVRAQLDPEVYSNCYLEGNTLDISEVLERVRALAEECS